MTCCYNMNMMWFALYVQYRFPRLNWSLGLLKEHLERRNKRSKLNTAKVSELDVDSDSSSEDSMSDSEFFGTSSDSISRTKEAELKDKTLRLLKEFVATRSVLASVVVRYQYTYLCLCVFSWVCVCFVYCFVETGRTR